MMANFHVRAPRRFIPPRHAVVHGAWLLALGLGSAGCQDAASAKSPPNEPPADLPALVSGGALVFEVELLDVK